MECELKVSDLRKVVDMIICRIEEDIQGGSFSINDHKNLYWEVAYSDQYRLEQCPSDLTVGKLSEDWEFLQSVLTDSSLAIPLMLAKVAPLLRAMAYEVSEQS